MNLRFFRTRIGASLLAALIIILVALFLRYKSTASEQKGQARLIVEQMISDTLKNVNQAEMNAANASSSPDVAVATDTEPDVVYTPTDKFSQEIFSEYISAKQSGVDITEDISSQIADKVLSQDYSDKKSLYSVVDMKVASGMTLSEIKSYGNALGAILTTPPAAKETEIEIFQKITTGPSTKYATELTAIKNRYNKMVAGILSLKVPVDAVSSQVNLVNALTIFIDAVDGAATMQDDPIGALGKIANYDKGMEMLQNSIDSLQSYFAKKGVTFSSQEKGFILMK